MAQLHATSGSLVPLATCIASAEHIVELAKNIINPVKCDWGAGTRAECGTVLGSWRLLQKHLHFIHCRQTKDGFVCGLPKCNRQLHLSHQALVDHMDAAHLSRLSFNCPIPNCTTLFLRGIDSLIKHYKDCHSNLEGQIVQLPTADATWEPISGHHTISSSSTTFSATSGSLPLPPQLPRSEKMQPGSALITDVHIKQLQRMNLVDEGMDQWFSSQPEASQTQGFASSQGVHPMARRQRTKVKQLEKMKEKRRKELEDEEGVPTILLDDLAKFDGTDDFMGLRIDVNARHHFGWLGIKGEEPQASGQRDLKLTAIADQGIVFGQRPRQLMVDLSRPQPMLPPEVLGDGAREKVWAPKSVLFDVVARKVDEMERTGVIDMSLI